MTRVRWIVLFAVVLCAAELDAAVWSAGLARSSSAIEGAPAAAVQSPPEPAPAVDLSRERELLDEAKASLTSFDYATARAKATEAVCALLGRPEADRDATWLVLLDRAGHVAADTQDARTARAAWEQVLEVRSRTLPDDHPDLQAARQNLAVTICAARRPRGRAGLLEEKVLEVRSRTLPDDHPDLQAARQNLAATIYALGDLAGARALLEKVLEVRSRTLPDDHPDLQAARGNLAVTIGALGDLAGARALAGEGARGPLAHAARRPPRPADGAGEPRRHARDARRPRGRARARRRRCSRSARARCPTTTPICRRRGGTSPARSGARRPRGRAGARGEGARGPLAHAARRPPRPAGGAAEPRQHALGARRPRGRAGAAREGARGPLAHAARRPPRPADGAAEPRRHAPGARRPRGRAGARARRCSRSARARCPTTTPTSAARGNLAGRSPMRLARARRASGGEGERQKRGTGGGSDAPS